MVDGPGTAEITGAVLSVTQMVWIFVLWLPRSSVAVQVRVVQNSCGQAPGVVTSAKVRVGDWSQSSVAVGVVKLGVPGHSTLEAPGRVEITGAVSSTTETTC